MMIGLLIGLFLLLCALRVPIAFGLAFSSLVIMWLLDVPARQVVVHMMKGMESFPLLAVPFFLLGGLAMNESGLMGRLLGLSEALVGRFRGGLGHVNVLVSMIFAGVSGSSTADTSGVGATLIPAMKREGWSSSFAAAVTAASSTMGNIIPPSIYMVLYGSLAGISIGALFLSGFIPGILIGLGQMVLTHVEAKRLGLQGRPPAPLSEVVRRTLIAFPVLLVGVIIIGGVISGMFTPTEAAAVALVYILIISVIAYRTVSAENLLRILAEGGKTYAVTLFTIACAAVFGWVIAFLDGPTTIAGWLLDLTTNPTFILLVVAGFLLISGTVLSEIATIIIFTPVFVRLTELSGIHPIHMGIVVVMMLCLGLITPPYGLCLLIAADFAKISVVEATRATLPFIVMFLLIVLIVILWPDVVLFLPRLIMPEAV